MNFLPKLKQWLEYLGGATETPPPGFPPCGWLALAVWWFVLVSIIAIFCGQTSKFIYIDF